MDLLEYQGKQLFARHGVPVPEGRLATSRRRRPAKAAEELGFPVVVKAQVQIGGPRQGRRDQARQRRRRGRGTRRGDPRDGHPGPHRARGLGRAGLGHRGRVLRRGRLRPQREEAPRDALRGGRDGRSRRSPEDDRSRASTSTRWSASCPSTAAGSPSRAAIDADVVRPVGRDAREALRRVRRARRDAGRGQPADRHRRPPGRRRSTPR